MFRPSLSVLLAALIGGALAGLAGASLWTGVGPAVAVVLMAVLAVGAGFLGARTTPSDLPLPDWSEILVEGGLAAVVGIALLYGALAVTPGLGISLLHIPAIPGFAEGQWQSVPPLAARLATFRAYHVVLPAGGALLGTLTMGFWVAIAVAVQRRLGTAAPTSAAAE